MPSLFTRLEYCSSACTALGISLYYLIKDIMISPFEMTVADWLAKLTEILEFNLQSWCLAFNSSLFIHAAVLGQDFLT